MLSSFRSKETSGRGKPTVDQLAVLQALVERAGRLGGTLRVESVPEEGTTIRVRIPPGT
jgi:signal transduction histidine kinase